MCDYVMSKRNTCKMLDLNDIFSEKKNKSSLQLEHGRSLLDDLSIWTEDYNKHLVLIDTSKNTLSSYRFTLKCFSEFCSIYHHRKKGLCEIDKLILNDFLSWMENYNTNKTYGSLKERIELLFTFINFMTNNSNLIYIDGRQMYLDSISSEIEISKMNFILDEFEDYYLLHEIEFDKIDNNYIVNYIEQLPKASISTMQNRRVALKTFFNYIADVTKNDCFEDALKSMKLYKKEKGKLDGDVKVIDKEVIIKLLSFIDEYTNNPCIFIKRVRKNSLDVAYRNTAMILLMYGAGCRVSEAINLRFCDIKEKDETYRINIIAGKGNKNRSTYIKKSLFKKHYEYLSSNAVSDTDYLSQNSKGAKLDRKILYTQVEKMFKFIGEDTKGLHIFRHQFGSTFAEENGNMKILQDLLGHSVISTTMIYSSVGEDAKEGAFSKKG